jgi:hypothetical protein
MHQQASLARASQRAEAAVAAVDVAFRGDTPRENTGRGLNPTRRTGAMVALRLELLLPLGRLQWMWRTARP